MADFYTHMDTDKRLTEAWRKHCKEAGSDESYSDWLIDKLIEAEERVAHHAEIASVCSATAERYAMALDSIIDAASILDFVASSNSVQIKHALGFARSKARLARNEAE